MPDPSAAPGVALPAGESASTFFLQLLEGARAAFPSALGAIALPRDGAAFKRSYAALLVEVEQRRLAAEDSAAIAAHIVDAVQSRMRLVQPSGAERSLGELGAEAEPLELAPPTEDQPPPGWRPRAPYAGRVFEGDGLLELIDELSTDHLLNPAMAETLRRGVGRLSGEGRLDLSGERFALLGAGAEIAPTRALLDAGATVLWCDVVPPPPELASRPGRLHHARGRGDLLTHPDRVAATVAAFAEDGPVHLGLFAYGPGKGREWRLGAAMNAVTRALPEPALRSVGLYVSPTAPAGLDAAEEAGARARLGQFGLVPRGLRAIGVMAANRSQPDLPAVADVVVPLQGVSYQAAQWVEKLLAAEALARARPGLRISANVAPVTETRSLEHPVFAAAFRGAPMLGVMSFASELTRTLSGLAYIEDVTGEAPAAPGGRHLHGGLFTLPSSLETALRIAAVRGVFGRARLPAVVAIPE